MWGGEVVDYGRAEGMVLVAVLLVTLLMSALGAALALVASSETTIAANFRNAEEARYAAGAGAERALVDMSAAADWSLLLDGTVRSTFADGQPSGTRALPDGSTVDLDQLVNLANCHHVTVCEGFEMDATTADRPWGVNNPRWRLFAYGSIRSIHQAGAIDSNYYTVVLIGDDPSETDGDPSRDGLPPSAGAGVVELRAHAFGPRGARRIINLTVGRTRAGDPRVISWREMR
jgi:hypothetical protein